MILVVNHIYPRSLTGIFFASIFLSFLLVGCGSSESIELKEIGGEAQGTYYSIKYVSDDITVSKKEIDFIFQKIDSSLSTYQSYSLINKINSEDSSFIQDPMMMEMIKQSALVYNQSEGAFDPTVMPLVRAWGFGPEGNDYVADMPIDSILLKVGWDKLNISISEGDLYLVKGVSGMQIDLNAIAQGYASDIIADYFNAKGIENYLIDTGGELRAKGVNQKGNIWTIGIDSPDDEAQDRKLIASFELNNKSVATSGNYRKFYVKDGVKYAHTISPFTGMPVEHTLLSATVITDTCSLADAYATALMVMGTQKAIDFVDSHSNIEAYLVFSDEKGDFVSYQSEGLKGKIKERD